MQLNKLDPKLRLTIRFLATFTIFAFCASSFANSETISVERLPICMNFGCKHKQTITLEPSEWQSVANWFKHGNTDEQTERENIKQAIGWMEVVVGRHTPTHRDVGGDLGNKGAEFPGQLDCIDEANNTTTYLTLFEQHDLLQFHKVVEQAYRRAIFDQHWAGQIESLESGERWVVDSWFQDNGFLPYMQESSKWEDIPFFTSYLDSSQTKDKEKKSFFRSLFN